MSSNPIFTPVQTTESVIKNLEIQNGWLYFATDSGRMYLDTIDDRISVGGAGGGVAIYYGESQTPEYNKDTELYSILKDDVKDTSLKIGDLILNSDGGFYKVKAISEEYYICTLLSISGVNGNVTSKAIPSLILDDFYDTNIINGSKVGIGFTAKSALGPDEQPLAKTLTITWKLFDGDTMYQSSTFPVEHNVPKYFEFGDYLRPSVVSTLQLVASGINHDGESAIREVQVSSTELTLRLDPDFSNKTPFNPDDVIFQIEATGRIAKKMEVRFDNKVIKTVSMRADQEFNEDIAVPVNLCTHGYHTVRVDLYPMINGEQGKAIAPIIFEVAVIEDGNETPIVWLGEYQDNYYTYDSIQIPYLAYDPTRLNEAIVYLYKNGVLYKDDTRTVSARTKFYIWEISDADNDTINRYQIACGNTDTKREASMREIVFKVNQDPRDLTVAAKNNLRLNFDPKGRNKNESAARRDKWSYTFGDKTINANFEKFNWYNNGWEMDERNNTFLRISNGAKFSIPIGTTSFFEQSNTFELMFKIRNVQNYGSLVTNITRYYLDDQQTPDDDLYAEFTNQTDFDNYDAFLQWKLGAAYDNLVFRDVMKLLNINNAVCKYCDEGTKGIIGWALGAQDAFFRDGEKAISVSYVDEDLVSLSIVYKYDPDGRNMILFYLNGVLTGADYTSSSGFNVGEFNPEIVFNTDFCDIDLYKMRVYNTSLDVNEIVRNFCVDRKDIDNFDLIGLAKKNQNTKEYQIQFDKVEQWNKDHPNNQTMPYIIFDTTNDPISKGRLPWSKSTTMNATITFVNTQLDQAYANGELEELAGSGPNGDKLWNENSKLEEKQEAIKTYYKHHCPSWTGDNCELVVQGTSSEFYPRRNYKIKTKTKYDSDKQERIHIFLNEGPFKEDYKKNPESTRQDFWYMNNYTNGTHKWTMKVDYMESSGSYNAGFASMVGNSYSKHPLEDYLQSGALSTTLTDENGVSYNGLNPKVEFKDQSADLVGNSNIRWQDYRTSLLGFPVMAFHKRGEKDYVFIGYYRMLLDKGSDEVLGFKPPKKVTAKYLGNKDMRKKAECWEFSNNSRTYCSYRDPEDRVQLSFMPSDAKVTDGTGLTAAGVPMVADCFEYRYNDNEDFLDILYNLGKKEGNKWSFAGSQDSAAEFLKETGIDLTSTENWPAARQKMIEYYGNWEKACQWIWSTCLDNVVSMGTYKLAPVGNMPFITDGSLHVEDLVNGGFRPVEDGEAFDENQIYFIQNGYTESGEIKWVRAYVYDNLDSKYCYVSNKFYQNVDGVYSLVSDMAFNSDIQYYELIIDDAYKTKSDLLVKEATVWDDSGETQYYTWDKGATTASIRAGNPSVRPVENPVKEEFDAGKYYVPSPVTYGTGAGAKTYHYDTQEYRAEKFVKELSSHFDLEYLATYFVMTEVFECYDSRGKNCMMASWGPLKEGGEYIWYPIFYDIDTQLGINNTGIPSFTFNVDATLQDNYSTSDSILWNNFYSFFRGSYILQKYKHLKGEDSIIFESKLNAPPLVSVQNVESWYLFDPEVTKNIAARGLRPLIATNLDSWYKYITTTNTIGSTNSSLLEKGDVGCLDRNGGYYIDTNGKFHMLQGDRSQSRQSFLTKRLDYIDSWLGVGGYQRSGSNCVRGRISANDLTDTSDKWMEGVNGEQYWKDAGENEKTHEFDAQYWVDLKPLYSTYISVSDDSAAYPPVKYDGINPVQVRANALESGVRKSKNYREQLLYIYGTDKMLDIGDMSNLYWREFEIDGKASKLTRLKLGHDGVCYDYTYDDNGNKVYSEIPWKNGYLNKPSFPSSETSTGMPLLKEVNMCNITIQAGGSAPDFDFSSCQKLQNFRATGSNITKVTFAKGVALDTLYLPATITTLSLARANLLTNVLKEYTRPIQNPVTKKLEAKPGLYIESFFDGTTSALNQLYLEGGSLGYGSFDIFSRFYDLRKKDNGNRLSLKEVNWCPYEQLVDGDIYDKNFKYFKDNGHYGFEPYEHTSDTEYAAAIVRGELYRLNTPYVKVKADEEYDSEIAYYHFDGNNYNKYAYSQESFTSYVAAGTLYYQDMSIVNKSGDVKYNTYQNLLELIESPKFRSFENPNVHADISGIIYIDNSEEDVPVDEYEIADKIIKAYPSLKLFMSNVKEAYSAKFVVLNDDGSYTYVPDINGDSTYQSIEKISQADFLSGKKTIYNNPFTSYNPANSKEHYDFVGWTTSLEPDIVNYSNVLTKDESNYWGIADPQDSRYNYKGTTWGVIKDGEINQIYYAVFIGHYYKATFLDKDNPQYKEEILVQYNPRGSYFHTNILEPVCVKPIDDIETRYTIKGWTATDTYGGAYSAGEDISEYLEDVSEYLAISDMNFYAVFQKESVYDSVTDNKYFNYDYTQGYPIISLKPEIGNNLTGKITIPGKDPSGKYIKGVGRFLSYTYFDEKENKEKSAELGINITHIFFEKDNQYKYVEPYAFANHNSAVDYHEKLKGIYLPNGITEIRDFAFQYLQYATGFAPLPEGLLKIGQQAFHGYGATSQNKLEINGLPSTLKELGYRSFRNSVIYLTELPSGISILPKECFENSPNVAITTFGKAEGSALEEIGEQCFYGAGANVSSTGGIPLVKLHKSVISLGRECFYGYGHTYETEQGIAGPEQIYTALPENDINFQKWDSAQSLTNNPNATFSNSWNGIE